MVAGLALATSQPVGHLLDLLGVDRRWPAVFDAMFDIQMRRNDAAESAEAKQRQESLVQEAKRRYGDGRRT
jgi:hypothetical protein